MPKPPATSASHSNWWSTWAPYWGALEDRHFCPAAIDGLTGSIQAPVLVIGSGQGLVVEHLRALDLETVGVDLSREMTALARRRRRHHPLRAEGGALPFGDRLFKTVFIASGVVDYITDRSAIRQIVGEARRVLSLFGQLFIAFYRLEPAIHQIYQKIGLVTDQGEYRLGRLFELFKLLEQNPLLCARAVARWTHRAYLPTLAYWTKLGLTLPTQLKAEHQTIKQVFERAKRECGSNAHLFDSVPPVLPYRDEAQIAQLLEDSGLPIGEVHQSGDCYLARHYRSSLPRSRPPQGTGLAAAEGNGIVRTVELCKRYQSSERNAVDHLNLSIEPGTVFGLLGPNGAGKTTTLSLLCGLLQPDQGEIRFAPILTPPRIKPHLGYVPQELALYPHLTARQNLAFFGSLQGMSGRLLQDRTTDVLTLVGLASRADDRVSKYSGGMKRRLNLAVGLLHRPKLILLDEPTVGIDPQSRNCIFDAIRSLRRDGVTVLYTTHYMEEAAKLCDSVSIIDRGRVVLQGIPADLVANYGLTKIDFQLLPGPRQPKRWPPPADVPHVHWDLESGMGRLSVYVRPTVDAEDVIHQVRAQAGAQQIDLTLRRVVQADLESLFLDVTGNQLRDPTTGLK